MKHSCLPWLVLTVWLGLWTTGGTAQAQTTTQTVFHVTINTSQLADHPAEPFSLQFALVDGSGLGDTNSSVLVTNFNFGATGHVDGDPITDGDASGDLTNAVTLRDSVGESDFSGEFSPGSVLTFDVYATLSLDADSESDEFVVAIKDSDGERIPTLDAQADNVLVRLTTADGVSISVESYGTDPTVDPIASGPPLDFMPGVLLNGATAPTNAPVLSISANGDGTANVAWPALFSSYLLESSPNLTNWSYLPVVPDVVTTNIFVHSNFVTVTNLTVTVSFSDAPRRFYRLSQ